MMGLIVIHGAQGGGFSPISVYGGITNQIVEKAGLPYAPTTLFLASLFFNLAIAVVVSSSSAAGRASALRHRSGPDPDTMPGGARAISWARRNAGFASLPSHRISPTGATIPAEEG